MRSAISGKSLFICVAIMAMLAGAGLINAQVQVDNDQIAGRAYDKTTSFDDLLSGREDIMAPLREKARSGVIRDTYQPQLRGGGTMDIGEIAVLEDDGTLVDPGTLVTDIFAIANAFLATHNDEYDELITFVASNFPGDVEPEAGFAFYLGLAGFNGGINSGGGNPNEGSGITRLNGLVNMNDLNEYPADFTTDFFGGGVASGVEIFGQEFEHAYGAFVTADTGDILGRGNSHWSFFLHHEGAGNASPMEGNRWVDNGDGTFTTVESFTGFGELDEYLMGLRAPADVSPFYLITPPAFDDATFPSPGVTVSGTRVNMTIQNIINVHGPRLPDTVSSMKTFKIAMILVIPQGTTALPGDIAKLDGFRQAWDTYFFNETEGLGTMDSTLAAGPVTTLPFSDNFDQIAPNSADWLFNQGCTISTVGIAEPSGGRSLQVNGGPGGGDELRSRVIDLSGFSPGDVTINYSVQRTGGGNSPEAGEDLLVEYFNNADTWVVLRTFDGAGADENTFTAFNDVLPADGLHGAFRLRFHRLQGSIGDFDDYFVDDVSIVGVPVGCTGTTPDCNSNGLADDCDIAEGTSLDCNTNMIPDECETDCDGNGVPDDCDLAGGAPDCNTNGVLDSCDVNGGGSNDCNLNGVPDECETDCDGNGVPDDCDLAGGAPDCNTNGVPDSCDITGGTSNDCNSNTVPDSCDITGGTSIDCDGNGTPDECDPSLCLAADVNCDGTVNALDLAVVQAPLNWAQAAGVADEPRSDVNNDGTINALDLAEIQAPLNWAVSTGPCACCTP